MVKIAPIKPPKCKPTSKKDAFEVHTWHFTTQKKTTILSASLLSRSQN